MPKDQLIEELTKMIEHHRDSCANCECDTHDEFKKFLPQIKARLEAAEEAKSNPIPSL